MQLYYFVCNPSQPCDALERHRPATVTPPAATTALPAAGAGMQHAGLRGMPPPQLTVFEGKDDESLPTQGGNVHSQLGLAEVQPQQQRTQTAVARPSLGVMRQPPLPLLSLV